MQHKVQASAQNHPIGNSSLTWAMSESSQASPGPLTRCDEACKQAHAQIWEALQKYFRSEQHIKDEKWQENQGVFTTNVNGNLP